MSADGRKKEDQALTLEFCISASRDRPILCHFESFALLRFAESIQELLDGRRFQFPELSDSIDSSLMSSLGHFVGEVRKLEERGRGRVNGLEEKLLETKDRNKGGEPVAGEGDGTETGGERESDGDSDEFF